MEKYPRLRAPRVTRGRASKCGRHPLVFFEPYLPAGVMATVYLAVSPSCSFVCPPSFHSFLHSLLPIISSSDGNDVIITTRPRRHSSLASIGQTVRAVDASVRLLTSWKGALSIWEEWYYLKCFIQTMTCLYELSAIKDCHVTKSTTNRSISLEWPASYAGFWSIFFDLFTFDPFF